MSDLTNEGVSRSSSPAKLHGPWESDTVSRAPFRSRFSADGPADDALHNAVRFLLEYHAKYGDATLAPGAVQHLAAFREEFPDYYAQLVSVGSGDGQSAPIGTAFGVPLVAYVKEATGRPCAGVTVTFTAPASGPSASLASTTAVTNDNGQASVTALANGIGGTYDVVASIGPLAGPSERLPGWRDPSASSTFRDSAFPTDRSAVERSTLTGAPTINLPTSAGATVTFSLTNADANAPLSTAPAGAPLQAPQYDNRPAGTTQPDPGLHPDPGPHPTPVEKTDAENVGQRHLGMGQTKDPAPDPKVLGFQSPPVAATPASPIPAKP